MDDTDNSSLRTACCLAQAARPLPIRACLIFLYQRASFAKLRPPPRPSPLAACERAHCASSRAARTWRTLSSRPRASPHSRASACDLRDAQRAVSTSTARRGVGLEDATDDHALTEHVEVVIVPFAGLAGGGRVLEDQRLVISPHMPVFRKANLAGRDHGRCVPERGVHSSSRGRGCESALPKFFLLPTSSSRCRH